MKNIIGMYTLAALVGMATISARTVRAESAALEGAKQESGIEFGEMSGLKARGGSFAVSASGDGVSRPALTLGKLDMKVKGRHGVPSPARALKSDSTSPESASFHDVAATVGVIGGPLGIAAGLLLLGESSVGRDIAKIGGGLLGIWTGAIVLMLAQPVALVIGAGLILGGIAAVASTFFRK